MSRDALVVGVNNYKNLPGLGAPAHDGEDIARCLESFGECRVMRLPEAIQEHQPVISQCGEVTTKMLEEALIRLFKPSGKNIPQTAIFYFSGHGLQRNAGIQEGYLATSDTNPALGHYGLSLYWLRRLLQESPVRQRVILLDCCNSGEFFNILEADPGAKSGTDRLFMAASREYEAAYESLTGSHSVFTQALLSGLNPYKVKGSVVNGHHLIDTVNNQLKGELQQPLFESSGTEIVLTRTGGKGHQPESTEVTPLDRLKQLRYKFCPFRGLAPFEPTQGDFFFGREDQTQALLQLTQSARLSLVTGASGIGKTSLLQAGLRHALTEQNRQSQGPQWDIRYVSLGHDPLKQMAECFVDPTVSGLQRAEQIQIAESLFQNRTQGITQLVKASLSQPARGATGEPRLMLVIDQFEALFTPGQDDSLAGQRQAILDGLTAIANRPHVPIHIVLGMRSQHLQDLEAYPEFHQLIAHHCLRVPPMTYDQLKATVIGPLDKLGLQYDANLIYTLLLDVVGAPGELPLLQLALTALWQHREESASYAPPRLTLETYVKLGGLRQMLRHHGTQVIENLSELEKPIAQRILLSLGEFGEGGTAARRQVELAEMVTPNFSLEQVTATINRLVAARLVVVDADDSCTPGTEVRSQQTVPAWSLQTSPGSPGLGQFFQQTSALAPGPTSPHFAISHDALLRHWPLLETWLREYYPWMTLQRAIEAAAMAWQQQHRPSHADYFLSQTRLSAALGFQREKGEYLSVLAHQYLAGCSQYARTVTRKRNLMRLLIPLSLVTGMVTAYGHSTLIRAHQAARPVPLEVLTPEADASLPQFQKARPGDAPDPEPSPNGPPQGVRTGLRETWGEAIGTRQQSAQVLRRPLAGAMEQSRLGLQAWQQRLQARASRPGSGAEVVHHHQSPSQLAGRPQLVGQWLLPTAPPVMIQVWCSHQPVPTCVATPVPMQTAKDVPLLPL
jgi:hypothetical protein